MDLNEVIWIDWFSDKKMGLPDLQLKSTKLDAQLVNGVMMAFMPSKSM